MRDLEKKSGVSFGTISDIESGRTKNPGLGTIIALAKAFNRPVSDFVQAYQHKDPDAATTSTPHPESTEALATRVIQDLDTMSKHVKQLLQAQGIATQGPTEPPPKA